MDMHDPLLSHQYQVVKALAGNFDEVTVITGNVGEIDFSSNIRIVSTFWKPGSPVKNLFSLISTSVPIIVRGDYRSVFFHMTDVQCAILSPIIRMRGKKVFLWYAHTYKSKYLSFANWWVSSVVTSTQGSCPIQGRKVISIGQGVDLEMFRPLQFEKRPLQRLIHIGRFDTSKNIQLLIDAAFELRVLFPDIHLTLVGSPSNAEARHWASHVIASSSEHIENGWLQFKDAIHRSDFPSSIAAEGCFFHAYTGSLDKSLIESTLLKVPVLTINGEYLSIFDSWSGKLNTDLVQEYKSMRAMSPERLENELNRRLYIAREGHSLTGWIQHLSNILR
jgi:glycosyltransferase involved in cell wall biosynthesis